MIDRSLPYDADATRMEREGWTLLMDMMETHAEPYPGWRSRARLWTKPPDPNPRPFMQISRAFFERVTA